jgi:3-oxoacyl-[acyl-carrier protein] reductase
VSEFSGRIALVTGASRGIGAATAVALARAGADVAINYLRNAEGAEATRAAVTALGRRACVVQADVSVDADVLRMAEQVAGELGPVDVLVNNAGQAVRRTLEETTLEDWNAALALHLKGAWLVTRAVLPPMRARRWGRIVNVSSGAVRTGGLVGVHYSAAKAALEGLTRAYARRLAAEGVLVNAVAPALVVTDMVPEAEREALAKRIPVGRLGTAEECAQAIVQCAANAYMTGQTVHLNGGLYYR